MKHIKQYEEINRLDNPNNLPQIGDYVICQYKDPIPQRITKIQGALEDINNFLSNNIGIITSAIKINPELYPNVRHYSVSYPEKIVKYMMRTYGFWEYIAADEALANFKEEEIIHNSPNKEDIEAIIQSNKYNL